MTLSNKVLCAISCVSFSLCAMEKQALSTSNNSSQTQSNQKYYYNINALYKRANDTLYQYNPRDEKSIRSIFEIIDTTTKLQNDGCEESSIGKFAYNQYQQHSLQSMPLYTSILFERIAQYKAHLKKNDFTAPTADQFMQHKQIPLMQAAIQTGSTIGVIVNLQKIDPNNTIIPTFPNAITDGIHEHEKLMEHISTILKTNLTEIKNLAYILYSPKL